MAATFAERFDPVRWADALGCVDADELTATLGRACSRADSIASDVTALQATVTGIGDVDPDTDDLLLRFRALAEAVWMVLDEARRRAQTNAHETPHAGVVALKGGVR